MKLTIYMRVAQGANGKPKVAASINPNYKPLSTSTGTWNEKALPTAAFAITLDIPDEILRSAEQVLAELEIPESAAKVAAEVA